MANIEKPLRILSLDGGGVRGLSSLLILRSIMENIAKEKKDGTSVDSMRPCDYFDCITGAGIGGVIALLLGRLKLTMLECTVEYRMLSSLKYREESISPLFDINDFLSICNRITKKYEISDILQEPGNEGPLTFVYAMAKNKKLQCLRTYPSADDSIDPERIPISTVMAALMTARGLFNEVSLNGESGDKVTFLDQPYPWSFSNPIIEAVTEAQGRTKGAEIGVIVSIGTGEVAKDDIQDLALLGQLDLPGSLNQSLLKMVWPFSLPYRAVSWAFGSSVHWEARSLFLNAMKTALAIPIHSMYSMIDGERSTTMLQTLKDKDFVIRMELERLGLGSRYNRFQIGPVSDVGPNDFRSVQQVVGETMNYLKSKEEEIKALTKYLIEGENI